MVRFSLLGAAAALAVAAALLAGPAVAQEVAGDSFLGGWSPSCVPHAGATCPPAPRQGAQATSTQAAAASTPFVIPIADGAEKPDFSVSGPWLNYTMYVDIVNGSADPCLVEEKCLSGTGMRTVLRFGTLIHNLGPGNAVVGETPATPTSPAPPWFVYSTCHQHFHYVGYADYSITNPDTNATVVTGHKNGFCLMDSICPAGTNGTHDCVVQGITTGCSDYYDDGLACQWIDITDANLDARKTYILSVTVNPDRTFPETNYDNNGAKVPFQLQNLQHVSTGKLERPAIGGPPLSDGAPPIHESARSVSSNEADGVPGVPKAFADEYVLLRTHVREGDATGQGSIPVEQPKLRRRCGAGRATCGRK